MTIPTPTLAKARFYEIDLLRFAAAVAVLVRHYGFRGHAQNFIPQHFPLLAPVAKYGYLGVELFFVISGFVILMTAYDTTPSGFVTSRIARLYPAFILGVTLTALTIVMTGTPLFHVTLPQYLANLTMVALVFDVPPVDGVYWTLEIELKFYFWIFALMCFNLQQRMQWVLGVWLAVIFYISIFGVRYAVELALFPQWAHYFIAGATCYLIRRDGISLYKACLLLLAYALSIKYSLLYLELMNARTPGANLSPVVVLSVITGIYLVFTAVALNKLQFLNKRRFFILGALTYPLYLMHQGIGYILFNLVPESLNKYVALALISAFMVLLSLLTYRLVERPCGRALKGFLRERLPGPGAKLAALSRRSNS